MLKLLIATTNPAKLEELRQSLQPLTEKGIQIVSLKDLNIQDDPEETEKTFEGNARLKAHFYAKLTGLPTLSDDGGFEMDALNGEPGVHSKRWLGRDSTDQELIDYAFERMKGIPFEKRTARGSLVLCYYNPKSGYEAYGKHSIEGYIAEKIGPAPIQGFPYRAIFIVKQYMKFYDELSEDEHEQVNHRRHAVAEVLPQIQADLLQ